MRLAWETQDAFWSLSVSEIAAIVTCGGLAAFRGLPQHEQGKRVPEDWLLGVFEGRGAVGVRRIEEC